MDGDIDTASGEKFSDFRHISYVERILPKIISRFWLLDSQLGDSIFQCRMGGVVMGGPITCQALIQAFALYQTKILVSGTCVGNENSKVGQT